MNFDFGSGSPVLSLTPVEGFVFTLTHERSYHIAAATFAAIVSGNNFYLETVSFLLSRLLRLKLVVSQWILTFGSLDL